MKQIIKRLLLLFVYIWSRLYTYNFSMSLQWYKDFIYTLWIRNFIGYVGKNTIFCRPLLLQGGGAHRIKIGSNTSVGHHTILGCWERYGEENRFEPEIIIGDDCKIGEYCHFSAIKRITIGSGLLTGRYVYIGDNAHGELSLEEVDVPPAQRKLTSKGEISIGRNVWIGDRVSILSGVSIGDNAIIGAGSIVTHNIPSNSLVAGAPAKVIKQLK
ncbi:MULTISPECIES: DapH/DapD/GlmU-related protein [Prevotellaceae]|uniref:acyltransferase n=1 Tax=Prevotellaceae TaxID=171552 RepID=UPI001F2F86AC|nr:MULTISPECIES: acyltransferase [Prevotellaceae]